MHANHHPTPRFEGTDTYVATADLKLAVNAALTLQRPLLIKGEPGTGKTMLAEEVADALGMPLMQWHIKSTTKAQQGLYEYDAVSRLRDSQLGDERVRDIHNYIVKGVLWQAFTASEPVVLLIDEIDKTDQEFEAMLLELLSDFQITIPELGQVSATTMPIVVLTSNDSRELTEALKRRCLYLWLDYPGVEREMEIVRLHVPELAETLARRLVEVIEMVRALDLKKPPSIAESIDWARTLLLMGAEDIDRETFTQSMSIIVKHRTDIDLVAERVGMKLAGAPSPTG